jgi:predicted SnoaL-like aldol condensation-catalyzing enzyme
MALRACDTVPVGMDRATGLGQVMVACVALLVSGCSDDKDESPGDTAAAQLSPLEQQNVDVATRVIEDGLIGGDVAVINELVRPDYIQHNVFAEDGREGLLSFVAALQAQGGAAVTIHRKLAHDNLVALHSTYGTGDARQVAFDVFRLDNGQLAEHWDALQNWVDPDGSLTGNTLVDGETTVTDRARTDQNQELVTTMVREVFVEGRYDRLPNYIAGTYIQHNPRVDNGLAGLQAFLTAVRAQGVQMAYTTSPLVVADGNFVLVGSDGYLGANYTVFYDLFRVDAKKLVEHWDVIQSVDLATIPHDNGPF